MGWITDGGAARGWALLISAALAFALLSAPASAQYPNFRNTIMYASTAYDPAAGVADNAKGCAEVTIFPDNDDFTVTPKPSFLYRVDPATGVSTLVGPITGPNLAGSVILGWLGPNPPAPFTQSVQDYEEITLSATEEILDVCGLAGANGKLYGTATLSETRIHVLIEIDPETAEATLIGSLLMDKGLFEQANLTNNSKADPTMCQAQDLQYVPGRGQLVALSSCMFREPTKPPYLVDPNDTSDPITVRTMPIAPRIQLSYIDIETGMGSEASGTTAAVVQDPSINNEPFTPLALAYRQSNGTMTGTIIGVYMHYNDRGGLDVQAQMDADLFAPPAPALGDNVRSAEAYWPLDRYNPALLMAGKTTALGWRPKPEELFRVDLAPDATSSLEPLDWRTGQPAGPAIPLTDTLGGDILGVQAITFLDYPDYLDQINTPTIPLDQLISCPATPRNVAQCNLASVSTKGSQISYALDKTGKTQLKMFRGYNLTPDDFGEPEVDTNYALCIYGDDPDVGGDDQNAPSLGVSLLYGRQLPAGANWQINKKRTVFKYKNDAPYTRIQIKLKSKKGYALIKLKAQELNFPAQPMDVGGVTLQLVDSNGQCWTGDFPNGTWLANSGTRFKARGP